jgi:glycosyltransferase involved in cell wall biosynthesis
MSGSPGAELSVCLLTYNHVGVIESTLDSVLAQSLGGFELIVSDDGSTDGTFELVSRRAAADARITLIRTPRNLGMAGNANFAARRARRPYLALLHHDDLYRADLLEKWHGVMQRHPDVGFVFNAYAKYDSSHIWAMPPCSERLPGQEFLERWLFPYWGCPVRGTALIRRSDFDAVGGMHEAFGLLADVDLWMRLAARAAVGYVPEPLIVVRHARPPDYPEAYQNGVWSWQRQRRLYEIHAQNRLEYFDQGTVRGRSALLVFRTRLSLETAKWLTLALLRGRRQMLERASESATLHDQLWLRGFRWLVSRHVARGAGLAP